MCEKCEEIDVKLERYRRLSRTVTDKAVTESLAKLTADLESEKAALHPKPEE